MSRIFTTVLLFSHCLINQLEAQQYMGTPIQLFDGHSTNGWVKGNGQAVDTGWAVVDGMLTRPGRGGDIFYEREFENYALSFEWKIAAGGNSGVKYRVKKYGNAWLGCEYQILDDKDRPHHKHSSASLYDVYEPTQNKNRLTPETWNQSLVVINRNHITHWLNGQKVVEADTNSSEWRKRIEASKFKNHEGFGENPIGKIMLQDHGHQVWFRSIVLTPIINRPATPGIGSALDSDHRSQYDSVSSQCCAGRDNCKSCCSLICAARWGVRPATCNFQAVRLPLIRSRWQR